MLFRTAEAAAALLRARLRKGRILDAESLLFTAEHAESADRAQNAERVAASVGGEREEDIAMSCKIFQT